MKNRGRSTARAFTLALCVVLVLSAIPVFAAAEPAGFRYEHDPRLNPRAMENIMRRTGRMAHRMN